MKMAPLELELVLVSELRFLCMHVETSQLTGKTRV